MFGILFSLPAAFIASSIYSAVLTRILKHWAHLEKIIKLPSIFILILIGIEVLGVALIGTLKLRLIVGEAYYPIHFVLFVLGVPALANLMQVQRRFPILSKWYVTAMICMVMGFGLVLLQYMVTDDLFGVDGEGTPGNRVPVDGDGVPHEQFNQLLLKEFFEPSL